MASAGGAGVTRITARFLESHILTRSCKADTILKWSNDSKNDNREQVQSAFPRPEGLKRFTRCSVW